MLLGSASDLAVGGEAAEGSRRRWQLAPLAPEPHGCGGHAHGGPCSSAGVGFRLGQSTFLGGPLGQTDGHHEVAQHCALQQLHQSHVILKCVGVVQGMEEDAFDPEMLFIPI